MKAIESQKITTFSFDDRYPGFRVDIVESISNKDSLYEAWLYHENYGVKIFMYGALKKCSLGIILDIENFIEDFIEDYIEDYMKEE